MVSDRSSRAPPDDPRCDDSRSTAPPAASPCRRSRGRAHRLGNRPRATDQLGHHASPSLPTSAPPVEPLGLAGPPRDDCPSTRTNSARERVSRVSPYLRQCGPARIGRGVSAERDAIWLDVSGAVWSLNRRVRVRQVEVHHAGLDDGVGARRLERGIGPIPRSITMPPSSERSAGESRARAARGAGTLMRARS